MSATALLLATRNHLRSSMSLPASECDVTEGGMPTPSAGERFVAVSEGEWRSNSFESLDEYFGVNVTVTVRTERLPWDRLGPGVVAELANRKGLVRLGEWVRAAVHSSYEILNAANDILGDEVNGFVEPLRLAGPGRIRAVGPDWFKAQADSDSPSVAGVVLVVPFQRARRVQVIDNQATEFESELAAGVKSYFDPPTYSGEYTAPTYSG